MRISTAFVAIVLAIAAIALVGQIQTVDAVKSSGTKNQAFGKSTLNQICGDRLCGADPSMQTSSSERTSASDLDVILKKMDQIHEKHQKQLRDGWSSLSAAEKIQLKKKMMEMIQKMENMDVMQHMDQMMKGHGDSEHGKMDSDKQKHNKTKQ